jgi:hypothetical protein
MRKPGAKRSRTSAISLMALFFVLIFSSVCYAGTAVGTVSQLSGPLFAKKADAAIRVLAVDSVIELGDTLVTEKKTYAKIIFTDKGAMILRPNSQFKVSDYRFEETAPAKDKAVFNLVRGGIRAVTGTIGKRGNTDSYQLMTVTATAGIRGTTFEARICEGDCGSIRDGVYFYVLDGIIYVRNSAGSQDIRAGRYAYVESADVMPQILPGNPGIDFSLPVTTEALQKNWGTGNTDHSCMVR